MIQQKDVHLSLAQQEKQHLAAEHARRINEAQANLDRLRYQKDGEVQVTAQELQRVANEKAQADILLAQRTQEARDVVAKEQQQTADAQATSQHALWLLQQKEAESIGQQQMIANLQKMLSDALASAPQQSGAIVSPPMPPPAPPAPAPAPQPALLPNGKPDNGPHNNFRAFGAEGPPRGTHPMPEIIQANKDAATPPANTTGKGSRDDGTLVDDGKQTKRARPSAPEPTPAPAQSPAQPPEPVARYHVHGLLGTDKHYVKLIDQAGSDEDVEKYMAGPDMPLLSAKKLTKPEANHHRNIVNAMRAAEVTHVANGATPTDADYQKMREQVLNDTSVTLDAQYGGKPFRGVEVAKKYMRAAGWNMNNF